jgi:23S rRNA (cytosine1962-C5)-methyltransferase
MKRLNAIITLKPGREKSLIRKHPWVFSGAISRIDGSPGRGETVEIYSSNGEFLAYGAFSPESQIRARVWTWDRGVSIDEEFFNRKLCVALSKRRLLIDPKMTDAYRIVHAESDGLPGLVVDKYNEVIVMQFLNAGAEYWRETLVDLVYKLYNPISIFERSDVAARNREGLEHSVGLLRGQPVHEPLRIIEDSLHYWVDIVGGHKTGFYLDQRDNRRIVRKYALGREVLDCFSYTGGFAINAIEGGATSVMLVDESSEALALAKENAELNNFSTERIEYINDNVFHVLRKLRDENRKFGLIILDPPKFAASKSQIQRASRGYKDINLLAMKLLNPEGILITFSCSGAINRGLFQKIVAGAALDAKVRAVIIKTLSQDVDHPVAINFPEGEYLKGLVCLVEST